MMSVLNADSIKGPGYLLLTRRKHECSGHTDSFTDLCGDRSNGTFLSSAFSKLHRNF